MVRLYLLMEDNVFAQQSVSGAESLGKVIFKMCMVLWRELSRG